jgi:hypothetical protein
LVFRKHGHAPQKPKILKKPMGNQDFWHISSVKTPMAMFAEVAIVFFGSPKPI